MRTVVVGISGGVDSAVAALLLKQRNYRVIGVFMKNWDEVDEKGICSIENDRFDAQFVCKRLKIPFIEIDLVKHYWNDVFSCVLNEYKSGFTPNPDILCNRYIKFNTFLNYSVNKLKADAIATGHYAKSSYGSYLEHGQLNAPVRLLQPSDKFKDQTFFLSQVEQNALQKVMFPLSNYLKSEVKKIAEDHGLERLSYKKESTGICFIGKRKFQHFIGEYIVPNPGNTVDLTSGQVVDMHEGIHRVTIGQSCRIGLGGYPSKYFIAKKDVKNNAIFVVPGSKHPSLFTKSLLCDIPHWIAGLPTFSNVLQCHFRFQHTKPLIKCQVCFLNSGLLVLLEKPLKAIAPGQYGVFYKELECLGSARILRPGPSLFSLNELVSPNYEEYGHF